MYIHHVAIIHTQVVFEQGGVSYNLNLAKIYSIALLKMGRYYSTAKCHYWDMSVK